MSNDVLNPTEKLIAGCGTACVIVGVRFIFWVGLIGISLSLLRYYGVI